MKLVNLKRQTNEIIDKTKKKRKPEKSEHTDSYDEGATTCANIEKQSPYYFLIMLLNHRDHNSEP